ncbi:MAG: hypothetical protein HON55_04785, partial [Legionellales bacterium]|nr:hypothetical protein [Legionellales bacterium]
TKLEKLNTEHDAQMKVKEEERADLQTQLQGLTTSKEQAEGQLKAAEERAEGAGKELVLAKGQLQELTASKDHAEARVNDQSDQITALQNELNKANERVDAANETKSSKHVVSQKPKKKGKPRRSSEQVVNSDDEDETKSSKHVVSEKPKKKGKPKRSSEQVVNSSDEDEGGSQRSYRSEVDDGQETTGGYEELDYQENDSPNKYGTLTSNAMASRDAEYEEGITEPRW